MKKIIFLILMALFLITHLVSATNYDNSCGIAAFIDPLNQFNAITFVTSPLPTGYVLVPKCSSDNDEINPDVFDTGCCCDGTKLIIFETALQTYPDYTSKLYCENNGYQSKPLEGDSCEDTCGGGTTSGFWDVEGHIFMESDESIPLSDAFVYSSYSQTSATTNNDGYYDLGEVPGNPTGTVEFIASTSQGFEIDGKYYSCNPESKNIMLTEDTELNFSLVCYEDEPSCVPKWEYSDWSVDCYPSADGQFYHLRTAVDTANNGDGCGTIDGLESLKNSTGCDESNINGNCNGVKVDEGSTEQCDGEEFIDPTNGEIVTSPYNCSDFAPDYYRDGEMSCTNCAYDVSNCVAKCTNVCRNYQDCGCDACKGRLDICPDPCDEINVSFMDEWRASPDFLTSRNVFDLYSVMENLPLSLIYTESTKDVTLRWSYDQTCTNEIYGYRIDVCKESSNSNLCYTGSKREFVVPNPLEVQETLHDILLEPNTNYCYNVCALNEDGTEKCAVDYNADEPLPCFNSGDDYCTNNERDPGLNCQSHEGLDFKVPTGCDIKEVNGKTYTNLSKGMKEGSETECNNKVCIETEYVPNQGEEVAGAMCVEPAFCSTCNGLFGIYADYDLYTRKSNSEDNIRCSTLEYNYETDFDENYPSEENNEGLCFKDNTKSSFSQFDTCAKVNTCYDYKSERTCLNDPCFKFINFDENNKPIQGCTWNLLETEKGDGNGFAAESNIGVCAPIKEESEECQTCDYDAPFGFCSEDQCNLYGNETCYFKDKKYHQNMQAILKNIDKKNNNYFTDRNRVQSDFDYSCLNKNDMSCYFYDNSKDCIGDKNSTIDVVYYEGEGLSPHNSKIISKLNKKRVIGSNKIITKSNDLFEFGVCKWFDGTNGLLGCVKDADGNTQLNYDGGSDVDDLDDCDGTSSDLTCLTDNIPPKTEILFRDPTYKYSNYVNGNISIYGMAEISVMKFSASDNVSSTEKIKTYASLLSLDNCQTCMPNFVRDNLTLDKDIFSQPSYDEWDKIIDCYEQNCSLYPTKLMPKEDITPNGFKDLSTGEYAMIYYSEDESHNLELVQSKHLYIDADAPIIHFNNPPYEVTSYKINDDIYKSDLFVSFTVSEKAICEGTLHKQGDPSWSFESGDIKGTGQSFETTYYGLLDGYYDFVVTCADEYQNPNKSTISNIEVQGDMSIHNPLPRGDIFSDVSNINLSLQTNIDATNCWFSQYPDIYPEENLFTSTDKRNFSFDFETFNFSQVQPWLGSYEFTFFTACDFEENRTEGNLGDVITFSVDNRSPVTTVYAKDKDGNFIDFEENFDYVNSREFELSCVDSNVLTPNLYFGCSELHYCFGKMVDDLSTFNVATDCSTGSWTVVKEKDFTINSDGVKTKNIIVGKEIGSEYPHLYYYSIDKGNNIEKIKRINMRVKDIEFAPPSIHVSTLPIR